MKGVGYFLGRLAGAEDDLDRISSPQIARFLGIGKKKSKHQATGSGQIIFIDYMDVSKNRGVSPQIIHFNRSFHDFHHPFWDTPILGNTHISSWLVLNPPFGAHLLFILGKMIIRCSCARHYTSANENSQRQLVTDIISSAPSEVFRCFPSSTPQVFCSAGRQPKIQSLSKPLGTPLKFSSSPLKSYPPVN